MQLRVVEACHQAAHVSREARLLKSLAADTVEDGIHAAKRAMKSVRRRVAALGDLSDQTAHRVKRTPLTAVAIALGLGVVVGLVAGWIGRGPERPA